MQVDGWMGPPARRRIRAERDLDSAARRVANTTGYTGCGTLFACLLYPVPPRVGDGPGKLAP
eukprot:SAG31_NODE_5266_length_2642_cov_2.705466_2_plen_61_part_01